MSTTMAFERQKRMLNDCVMMNRMCTTRRTKQPKALTLLWTAFLIGSCHCFVSRSPFLRARTTAARHVGLSIPEQSNWTASLAADDNEELIKESRPSAVNGALTVPASNNKPDRHRKLDLFWCDADDCCKQSIRERVVGDHNNFEFDGPATGQVCFVWNNDGECPVDEGTAGATASVLFLVKRDDDELMRAAADAIKDLTDSGIQVYLVPDQAAKIGHYNGVHNDNVHLFEPQRTPGVGDVWMLKHYEEAPQNNLSAPDMICTLGGDGLLMHANVMFQGPVPPILCVAGGSLGFLTPFTREEMVDAIRVSLGMVRGDDALGVCSQDDSVAIKPYATLTKSDRYFHAEGSSEVPRFKSGLGNRVCISMRMRLECKVINGEGVVQARFNVLNEVSIDRGSSPYLAALECFCDNVHLTTVQADGVIFAT
jgi:NAD+ kinase